MDAVAARGWGWGMKRRIKIKTLPNGDTTDQGPYYATIDGENVGLDGRSHWHTYADAQHCAVVNLYRMHMGEKIVEVSK